MEKKFVKEIDFPTSMGPLRIEINSELPVNPESGSVMLTGEVIEKVNKFLLSLLAEKEGMFTPKELMFIFSTLPYTQAALAAVMKKDKSTLTYYKKGVNAPDPLFCRTLQEIISDYLAGKETTMNRLRRMVQADQGIDLVMTHKNKVLHMT